MRIAFQSKPEAEARFFVRFSEFSFEAYPVQVSHAFQIAAVPQGSPGKFHNLCQSVLSKVVVFTAFRKNLMAHRTFPCARRRSPVAISQF